MANSIVLIGYMGSGKTTVGKALAKKSGRKFLDTDAMIVSKKNMSINEIFDQYGEAYFRDLETELLKELEDSDGEYIISCGGGLPVREENRPYLKRIGKVVYLNVNETDILMRLRGDTTRPLLRGPKEEVRKRIHDMIEKRDPAYRDAADIVINTGKLKVSEIVDLILDEGDK